MSYKNLTEEILDWVGGIKENFVDKINLLQVPYSDIALKFLSDKDKSIQNFQMDFFSFIEFLSCSNLII
jgi:hypothetical protein